MYGAPPGEYISGTTSNENTEDFSKECVVRVILKKNVVYPETLVYVQSLFFPIENVLT